MPTIHTGAQFRQFVHAFRRGPFGAYAGRSALDRQAHLGILHEIVRRNRQGAVDEIDASSQVIAARDKRAVAVPHFHEPQALEAGNRLTQHGSTHLQTLGDGLLCRQSIACLQVPGANIVPNALSRVVDARISGNAQFFVGKRHYGSWHRSGTIWSLGRGRKHFTCGTS